MQGKGIGRETLDITTQMNPRQQTLNTWYDRS